MESLDELIKRILRDLERIKNSGASEIPQIIEEISSFSENLEITDGVNVTEYVPQTTLATMTIQDAKVYE